MSQKGRVRVFQWILRSRAHDWEEVFSWLFLIRAVAYILLALLNTDLSNVSSMHERPWPNLPTTRSSGVVAGDAPSS
jgi:hypothetical protein